MIAASARSSAQAREQFGKARGKFLLREYPNARVRTQLSRREFDDLHMRMRGGHCSNIGPITIQARETVFVELKVERNFEVKVDEYVNELTKLAIEEPESLVLIAHPSHLAEMAEGDDLQMMDECIDLDEEATMIAIIANAGELPMTIPAGTELMQLQPEYMPAETRRLMGENMNGPGQRSGFRELLTGQLGFPELLTGQSRWREQSPGRKGAHLTALECTSEASIC
jgi:hypothetical protein